MPTVWFVNNVGDSIGNHSITLRDFRFNSWFTDGKRLANADLLLVGHGDSSRTLTRKPFQFVERIDTLGNVRWRRFFPLAGPYGQLDISPVLAALPDGGALISIADAYMPGSTRLDPIPIATLVRLDSVGNTIYSRQYGQPYGALYAMQPCRDGSYVLAGYQERAMAGQAYRADGWVLRVNGLTGDTISSRYFSSPGRFDDYFYGVKVAPNNEVQLAGSYNGQGWLLRLDSLNRVQWQHTEPPLVSSSRALFYQIQPLASGQVLVLGERGTGIAYQSNYLASYVPPAPGSPVGTPATTSWQRQYGRAGSDLWAVLDPNGSLTLAGQFDPTAPPAVPDPRVGGQDIALTRYANAGLPYVPDLCRTPPLAQLGYAPVPTGDSLRFVSLSLAGPRYAQLLRWRWDFGDGTHYDGPVPPPHRYPAGTAAGTAVRLTVTNNLGCTSTAVTYPFALATAAQRALQARLALYPNPTAGAVTLEVAGWAGAAPVPLDVLNALGQVVRHQVLRPQAGALRAVLDVAALPPGVYAVRLDSPAGPLLKRLVRE